MTPADLDHDSRRCLLAVARQAIEDWCQGNEGQHRHGLASLSRSRLPRAGAEIGTPDPPNPPELPSPLARRAEGGTDALLALGTDAPLVQPCGAFVSLKRKADGALRGCVGFVEPRYPLFEAVARAAVAAASSDYRFEPVTRGELPSLRLQVSAVGPVAATPADRIEAGVHGLIIRCDGRGGLLLPQVAAELGWGREELLDGACRKAGLPSRAWQRPDAVILTFTAQVFGEE